MSLYSANRTNDHQISLPIEGSAFDSDAFLTRFFRWAFIYLGVAGLIHWCFFLSWYGWMGSIPTGLVASLVFLGLALLASRKRNTKVLFVMIFLSVFVIVSSIIRILPIGLSGSPFGRFLFKAMGAVNPLGQPFGWITESLMRKFYWHPFGPYSLLIVDSVQHALAIPFYLSAMAKQPKETT